MKKDTKHNILETCMHILLGLIVITIYVFIEGIVRSIVILIILCPIAFCIFIILLVIVCRARPYKNHKKKKAKSYSSKNKEKEKANDQSSFKDEESD